MPVDFLNGAMRRQVVDEIRGEENRSRKREQQKRFDIYRDRQDRYIIEKLRDEFSVKTVQEMRKVLSINLSKRIINSMASIYSQEPEREFSNANERELEQIENLYSLSQFDAQIDLANKYYKLHDQCALLILPKKGRVMVRPLAPFMYDVIPDPENPEEAFAFIMNVWDLDHNKTIRDSGDTYLDKYRFRDDANQKIADDDDRKRAQERYVVWTNDLMFTMNGNGTVLNEDGIQPNPIGRLPFIDIATEKDFQYFVRRGSTVTDFAIDFSLQLSDLSNITRLQGYSQAIVFAQEQPTNMTIGPNHVLFLQLDPAQPELSPRFEFASPSPDLGGALEFLETQLRLFLSSQNLDPGTISGKGDSKSFSSGIERLLAMLDKFEASRSDFSIFRGVEEQAFSLIRDWSNLMQGVTENGLVEDLNVSRLNDNIDMTVKFHEPAIVRTQSEKEEAVYRRLDERLMTRKKAVMVLDDVNEDKAEEILLEIEGEDFGQNREGTEPNIEGEQPEVEVEP